MIKRGEYGGALPAIPDEKMGRLREYPFSNKPHKLSSATNKMLKKHMSRKRRQRDNLGI